MLAWRHLSSPLAGAQSPLVFLKDAWTDMAVTSKGFPGETHRLSPEVWAVPGSTKHQSITRGDVYPLRNDRGSGDETGLPHMG